MTGTRAQLGWAAPVGLLLLTHVVTLSAAAAFDEDGQVLTVSASNEWDNKTDGQCHFSRYSGQARCDYAKADEDCWGGNFNYLEWYACSKPSARPWIVLFFVFLLLSAFYLLGTTADAFFCPQVEELSDHLGLTPRLAGVTLVSLGNGAPDVFAGIAAVRSNQTKLVLGQITGAGMFVTSVVAGGVIHVAGGIRTRFPLLRDIMMYLVAVSSLCALTYNNSLELATAGVFLLYYCVFVFLAWYSDRELLKRVAPAHHNLGQMPMLERSATQRELLNKEYRLARMARMNLGTALDHLSTTSEGGQKRGVVSFCARRLKEMMAWVEAPFTLLRSLTIIDCVEESWSAENDSRLRASLTVVFSPVLIGYWFGADAYNVGSCPVLVVLFCVGLVLALVFVCLCPTDHPPRPAIPFLLLGFLCAAVWVDLFASELVDLLTALGGIMAISEVVMGATVLAWGNCVGDLTSDVLLARNKREGMAITACFGGPLFNLLIVVGFGVLLAGSHVDTSVPTLGMVSFATLIASLTCTLVVAFGQGKCSSETGNRLPKAYSKVLWGVYFAYVVALLSYEFSH